MLTQRAALLGFVAFCFYLIAVVNSLASFYYVLTWLTLGLSLASLGLALLSLSGLETSWSFSRSQGHAALSAFHPAPEDAAPTFEIALQNNASLGKTGLVLELQFEREGEETTPKKRGKTRNEAVSSHSFLIEAVPAGASVQISIPLRFLPRGQHRLREIRLVGSDVLGVFRVSRRLPIEGEAPVLTVAPAILEDASTALAQGAGRALSGTLRARGLGRGDELRGTRTYAPGDDLRHIEWKTTARTGQLAVREWEHTGRAAALLIWNGAASSPLVSEVGLCLVASLGAACGRAGVPRALAVLGAQTAWIPARENVGRELSSREIEALAKARSGNQSLFSQALSPMEINGHEAIFVVGGAREGGDESFATQLGKWLARGAQVTVLWIEESTPKKRGRKAQSETPKTEELEKTGARVFRLEIENGAIEEEKLREFLLRVAVS